MASITQEIQAEMVAGLVGILTSDQILIGQRETESNNTYPRVVLVPIGGPIVPPDRVGHGKTDGSTRARIIAVRQLQISVECHAATDEDAETLLHDCVVVVRNAVHASGPFVMSESYPDQEPGEDSFDKAGSLVVFTFTVNVPIYESLHPLKSPVTFVEQSETFAGESVPCNV